MFTARYELCVYICIMLPSVHKTQPKCSAPSPCHTYSQQHTTFFFSQRSTLLPAYIYQKDERALPGNLSVSTFSDSFPPFQYERCLSLQPIPRSLSLSLSLFVSVTALKPLLLTLRQRSDIFHLYAHNSYEIPCSGILYNWTSLTSDTLVMAVLMITALHISSVFPA